MFNLGRFNLLRFNVRVEDGDTVLFGATMEAAVRALCGSGENIHEAHFAVEGLLGAAQVCAGVRERWDAAVAVGMIAAARSVLLAGVAMDVGFDAAARLVQEVWQVGLWDAPVCGQVRLGGDLRMAVAMDGGLLSGQRLSMNVRHGGCDGYGAFAAQVSTRRFVVEEAFFDVTLPRGGVLVIDSADYTMTLNGADVIDKQDGTWLWLDRDVYDIAFDANVGDVGKVAKLGRYQEKWL